ncbi:MAG TPA: glutathione S-transferase [Myxococcales bacterium]|nr:glutathione S-transferase [Myxococcales bacterium]
MVKVYGCRISYFTGKLETYLRFRSMDYECLPTVGNQRRIRAGAGAVQMPVVELEDGRWLSDSTPMIRWFEDQQDAPSIYPETPTLRFVALLVEDYADEWLWRPAMHYRWSYRQDRQYASGAIFDDLLKDRWIPRWLGRRFLTQRQRAGFVRGDGVTRETWDHVERGYLTVLDRLEAIFNQRDFVLGDSPTIADIGLMGPMLRHFGQDPTPAEIMRNRAPRVYEWVARMWNARPGPGTPSLISGIDTALGDLLGEVAETHLAQLRENAVAYAQGAKRYDQVVQGCSYIQVPVSRYRVWCLERLRKEWAELGEDSKSEVRAHLPGTEGAILWEESPSIVPDYDLENRAPFNLGINVFGRGVPPR